MKPKHMAASDIIELCDARDLVELVDKLCGNLLDREKLLQRVNEEKRKIDMRKDPNHESWMEQR